MKTWEEKEVRLKQQRIQQQPMLLCDLRLCRACGSDGGENDGGEDEDRQGTRRASSDAQHPANGDEISLEVVLHYDAQRA